MMQSKSALARSLGIARSSLYYHPLRPDRDRALRDQILQAWEKHPAYGHRRLALYLQVNKKRILRIMRLYHLHPVIVRKRRQKRDAVPSAIPNRIKDLLVDRPNQVWVGDFTYLWYCGRYIYLATVIELYTREVIGWQIGLHHTTRLVLDVLEEALRKREATPLYFHSDQGSEYASSTSQHWLLAHRIQPSHSPKGKPWHNGHQESFFSSFKLEFGKTHRYSAIEDLIEAIGRYIHYYNTERIHTRLKMAPKQFFLLYRTSESSESQPTS